MYSSCYSNKLLHFTFIVANIWSQVERKMMKKAMAEIKKTVQKSF